MKITRLDQSASDLHVAAAQSANAKITRRLLALTFVLDAAAAEGARSCGEFGAYLSARRMLWVEGGIWGQIVQISWRSNQIATLHNSMP